MSDEEYFINKFGVEQRKVLVKDDKKQCTKCNIFKDMEAFHNRKADTKYGKMTHCKECCKVYELKKKKINEYYRLKNNFIQLQYLKETPISEKELERYSKKRRIKNLNEFSDKYKELLEKHKDELKALKNELGLTEDVSD
jgi:hypothetical protein